MAPVSTPKFEFAVDNLMKIFRSSCDILTGSFGLNTWYGGRGLILCISPGVLNRGAMPGDFMLWSGFEEISGDNEGLLNLRTLICGDEVEGGVVGGALLGVLGVLVDPAPGVAGFLIDAALTGGW